MLRVDAAYKPKREARLCEVLTSHTSGGQRRKALPTHVWQRTPFPPSALLSTHVQDAIHNVVIIALYHLAVLSNLNTDHLMNNLAPPVADPSFRIERELLKELAKPAPKRLLLQTAVEWLWIACLIATASQSSHMPVSIGCMILIATRQHALLALMHEYSHYQFSRKHAWLNDLVGDVFTALPFFITVHGFRRNHMLHHRHVWTEQDPNWVASSKETRYQFPKTSTQVFSEIAKHCVGWYTLRELQRYTVVAGMAVDLPRSTQLCQAVFAALLIGTVTYFEFWSSFFLFWLLPLATVLMGILYIRDLGEHFGMPREGLANSRTVVAGWVERILIAQNGVNFHTEHHLYPSVPFFRLRTLHQALMAYPEYEGAALITRGYFKGLTGELTADPKKRQDSNVVSYRESIG